jgi:preprotein translocase subunit SecA
MCAILIFLQSYRRKGSEQFNPGHVLQEVKTGEGKSFIVAVLALIYSLYNYDVDIITSSSILAKRDADENRELFELFDISIDHSCQQDIEKRKKCY